MYEQLIRKLRILATAEDATGMADSALAMREAAAALEQSAAPAVPVGDGCAQEGGSMYRCREHGGYGFAADCYMCKLASPAATKEG